MKHALLLSKEILSADLVECFHFWRCAVRELHFAEVPLGAVDVLRGGHQVVAGLGGHRVAALQITESRE